MVSAKFKDAMGTEIRTRSSTLTEYKELLVVQNRAGWKRLVEKIVAEQEQKG